MTEEAAQKSRVTIHQFTLDRVNKSATVQVSLGQSSATLHIREDDVATLTHAPDLAVREFLTELLAAF